MRSTQYMSVKSKVTELGVGKGKKDKRKSKRMNPWLPCTFSQMKDKALSFS